MANTHTFTLPDDVSLFLTMHPGVKSHFVAQAIRATSEFKEFKESDTYKYYENDNQE